MKRNQNHFKSFFPQTFVYSWCLLIQDVLSE
ncbi:hypothetical protein FSU_1455 [Fibrobacter succinogenes subsp. succinogenes S85]|uniref:Uncharacterized protein n=1 Tax=Fibrobacter succinogenes (strain ATCC 19169 / S85) TaxID=59374 RepID=D9SAB5_FIBSS|nr:hypothetical protein FSU_1455 [Fibrobacter succinogenes subsp. succinogenes S85]